MQSVVEFGRLVVQTYDKPLMAISYARLALAHFMAMELALKERQTTADGEQRQAIDARIEDLARALRDDLGVAEERALSQDASDAAGEATRAAGTWDALRLRLEAGGADESYRAALDRRAATVVGDLDRLVEITAEDGFRDRERALRSIASYRTLSIDATALRRHPRRRHRDPARRPHGEARSPPPRARRGASPRASSTSTITHASDDEFGELLESMAVMRDNIRAMMEREISARRSAQTRLVNAIESSDEGVIVLDSDSRTVIANSQIASFFAGLTDAFTPGALLPQPIEAVLSGPTGEMALADGRWLRLTRSPTADGGFVVVASDITALKDRERRLREAKEEAELASRSKTEFLANMSHELRTPLNAIIGFSEIMAHQLLGPIGQPKYAGYVHDILRSGKHLLDVINDILDIAKLQSGKAEIELLPMQLGDVVDDAVQHRSRRRRRRPRPSSPARSTRACRPSTATRRA